MIEYTEKAFCPDCNDVPYGFEPGCRWEFCPFCGVELWSDAEHCRIDMELRAEAANDEAQLRAFEQGLEWIQHAMFGRKT